MTGADSPHRKLLAAGCLLAGLGVAAGAFGAHSLEGRLSAEALAIFDTAARYHMLHALGLILLGLAAARWPEARWRRPGMLMLGGVAVFSGTLYALALSGIGWLGAITPIGGAALIAAWIWAAWIALTQT
ncbi:MAG: DUF423 domain-containing protein [Gemmatimonadota bacterium]|nr:DUF423 domain-containing protein [Gemmatimonadota bacterium]